MDELRQSSVKRQKISAGDQNMTTVDRLSSLSDGIICHILSFLPTKLSVATSILGKRWRFLWAHVPCLDFGMRDYTMLVDQSAIIHRFILHHEAKRLDTLSLQLVDCNEYQLETWIIGAIKRNIQNLNLDVLLDEKLMLPLPIFTCKTIVDMKIYRCKGIPSSGDIRLPSLKKLHLDHVEFEDDEALPHLLSGCPLLEELILLYNFGKNQKNVGCFNISSPTLKTLSIHLLHYCCCGDVTPEVIPDYRILINTKALRSLRMINCPFGRITNLANMTFLDDAFIRVGENMYMNDSSNYNVVKFVNSICNVKYLMIPTSGVEEVFEIGFLGFLRKFGNLTKLELQLGERWHLLVDLLEAADNLQVLVIEIEKPSHFTEPKRVPTCLLSSLRTITIKITLFEVEEFRMVRYLLKNSLVLEKMEILPLDEESIPNNLSEGNLKFAFFALQMISLFERGSTTCQLAFYLGF
ncbi:F-box/FBD/LRR-repeat protein [Striga hermonthica]|uniref:F-box/FBD/LRR-repeat protein n=1 Tax=Striga hermonthica TaxID=68872 RepID=A0A9N7MM06_STRHE|nr:F-box/FBD/LRR-repeat protein [Striga hermonthica]